MRKTYKEKTQFIKMQIKQIFIDTQIKITIVITFKSTSVMTQNRKLVQILIYKANIVTFFRLFMLFVSTTIFSSHQFEACSLLMGSVVLDYVDGIVARSYNQCSFLGECIDWLTDISSSILMFLWWYGLQPHLLVIFFICIVAQVGFMVFDLIAKASYFSPVVKADTWFTYILKFTLQPGKEGYRCVGLGYWNMILYYVCGMSRILYLVNGSAFWWWIFIINIIPAVSYVLMNNAYTINILRSWEQRQNEDGKIQVVF